MESEKVKDKIQEIIDYDKKQNELGGVIVINRQILIEILTLINELESENERLSKELDSEWKDRRKAEEDLHKSQWNYKIGLGQSKSVNKKLKDRISELEKENDELKQPISAVDKAIINIARERNKKEELASKFIDSYNDSLKQFAERLKEDFIRKKNRLIKAREIGESNDNFIMVDSFNCEIDGLQYAIDNIDETLKEFLKK